MNRPISSALAVALLAPTFSWAACDLASGPKTAALVELYTSEGCSSCPPADKRVRSWLPNQCWEACITSIRLQPRRRARNGLTEKSMKAAERQFLRRTPLPPRKANGQGFAGFFLASE